MAIYRRGRDATNHWFRLPVNLNLLVHVRHRRLIDITTLTVNGDPVGTSGGQIKVLAGSARYHTTFLDFPEIIRPAGVPRDHRYFTVHHIRSTSAASRPWRLSLDRLRIPKSEFEEMLRSGTARRSDSPWASPLNHVPMTQDGCRP